MTVAVPRRSAGAEERLARKSLFSFAGSACSSIAGFVFIVGIARALGDRDAGIVLQAVGAFMIALGFSRFGMDSAAVWLLPRLAIDQQRSLRPTILMLVATAGIAGCVAWAVVAGGNGLIPDGEGGRELQAAIRAVTPFLPIAAMLLTVLAVSRALGRIREYVLIGSVGVPVVRLLTVGAAILWGASLSSVLVAWALPFLLGLIVMLFVAARGVRGLFAAGAFRLSEMVPVRQVWGFAVPRVVSAGLEQLLLWLSVLIVGAVSGPSAAGVYGVASRLVAAGLIVDTTIRIVFAPNFSRMLHRGERAGVRELHQLATSWLVLFSAPLFVLLAVFAPFGLGLLGDSFAEGAPVLGIMAVGAIITSLAGNVQTILLTAGRSGLAAANKAVVVAVNVALIILFTPRFGIAGAAVAWTIATALDAALAWAEVRWILRLPLAAAAGLRGLAVACGAIALPAVLARWILGATGVGLLVALLVGGVAFGLCGSIAAPWA
ncbi:polysaccharide biosynthesis C-terminal domain-containing protein [Leucobacter luti]|uniref:oligosaccharide flippase family protein n=1 Tax=Leucobacter luti TaxID=340320 RepID=UPI003CFC2477